MTKNQNYLKVKPKFVNKEIVFVSTWIKIMFPSAELLCIITCANLKI